MKADNLILPYPEYKWINNWSGYTYYQDAKQHQAVLWRGYTQKAVLTSWDGNKTQYSGYIIRTQEHFDGTMQEVQLWIETKTLLS